jgi:hypothetical protein
MLEMFLKASKPQLASWAVSTNFTPSAIPLNQPSRRYLDGIYMMPRQNGDGKASARKAQIGAGGYQRSTLITPFPPRTPHYFRFLQRYPIIL